MPRIPEVVIRPRLPTPRVPTRVPTPRRRAPATAGLRTRTEKTIATIVQRFQRAQSEFYAIGTSLNGLNRPEVIQLYGASSFEAFVSQHILPHRTAARFMLVAASYPKAMAEKLGVEKGYQLARLAKIDVRIKSAPRQLVIRDARLGTDKKRISAMSARDIEQLVTGATLRAGRARAPSATRSEQRAISAFRKEFIETFGVPAKVEIDAKRRVVLLEIPLDSLLE